MEAKAWLVAVLCGLALIPLAVTQEISQCTVMDFASSEVMYSYQGTGTQFSNRDRPIFQIADGNDNFSPEFTIAAQSSTTDLNRETECYLTLKTCKATVGYLELPEARQHFFGESSSSIVGNATRGRLQIKASASSSSFVDCYVVGRTLDMPGSIVQSTGVSSDTFVFSAGLDSSNAHASATLLGISLEINEIAVDLDASLINIQGISVSYSGGPTRTFGNFVTSDDVESVVAASVTSVTVYYTAASNGNVCGLSMTYVQGASGTPPDFGCSSNGVTYTISSDFRLAGFAGFSGDGDSAFTLQPLQYQRLQPMVFYYDRTDSGVTLHVNAFFPLSGALDYSYTPRSGLNTDYTGLGSGTTVSPSVGSNGATGELTIDISGVACGCVPIEINFVNEYQDSNSALQEYATLVTFTAWTFGYTVSSTVSYGSNSNADSYETMSRYWSTSVPSSGQCPEMLPRVYNLQLYGGFMYIDGILGPDVSVSTATSYSALSTFSTGIDQVTVYHDSSGFVVGLQFSYWNSGQVSIGQTSSVSSTPLTVPANSILLYLTVHVSTSGDVTGVDATFGEPTPPCFPTHAVVADIPGEWYDATSPLSIGMSNDADLMQVWFYMPVDAPLVHADLTGYFLQEGESYNLTLAASSSQSQYGRASVVHAYFYALQAEHSYTVDYSVTDKYDKMSVDSVTDTFETPSGIRYDCDVNGNVYEQVEWEALPDVEIKAISDSYNDLTQSAQSGDSFQVVDSSPLQDQWPTNEYFHYDENGDCYPKFMDFVGYPAQVLTYYTSGESCIEGLALVYMDSSGDDVVEWLAGTQAQFDSASTVSSTVSLTDRIGSVSGSRATQAIGAGAFQYTCLATIQFQYASGVGSTLCSGPGSGDIDACDTTLVTGDATHQLSSISFSTISGNYIVGSFTAQFVYVDMPKVETNVNCMLDDHIDWYYIRDTAWYRQLSLETDFTVCAITQEVYDHNGLVPVTIAPDQLDPIADHHITYTQKLVRTRDNSVLVTLDLAGGLNVSRFNDWQVNLFCYYNSSGLVSSSFKTHGEDAQNMSGINEFDFTIKIYDNADFVKFYPENEVPIMLLNEPVYMATELLQASSGGYSVLTLQCWAEKDGNGVKDSDYYSLTGTDGCTDDPTFHWLTVLDSDPERDAFMFDAFGWFEGGEVSTQTVYISCQVRACPTSNTQVGCTRNDDPCPSARARRNAESTAMDTFAGGDKVVDKVITSAFIVKRRDVSSLGIDRSQGPMGLEGTARKAAGLFSLFVTTMFFCLIAITYKVYKLRQNYVLLKNIDGQIN